MFKLIEVKFKLDHWVSFQYTLEIIFNVFLGLFLYYRYIKIFLSNNSWVFILIEKKTTKTYYTEKIYGTQSFSTVIIRYTIAPMHLQMYLKKLTSAFCSMPHWHQQNIRLNTIVFFIFFLVLIVVLIFFNFCLFLRANY